MSFEIESSLVVSCDCPGCPDCWHLAGYRTCWRSVDDAMSMPDELVGWLISYADDDYVVVEEGYEPGWGLNGESALCPECAQHRLTESEEQNFREDPMGEELADANRQYDDEGRALHS